MKLIANLQLIVQKEKLEKQTSMVVIIVADLVIQAD